MTLAEGNARLLRWTVVAVVAVVVAGVGGYLAIAHRKDSRYRGQFSTVALGDNKDVVIQKMGKPDDVVARPKPLYCDLDACESEFMYGTSIPPVWWVVGFDRDSLAVFKTELVSP